MRAGLLLPRSCALQALDLQRPDALLPQFLLFCERVSLWAKRLATRQLKAMPLSQPVRAIRRAIRSGRVIDLVQRKGCQRRLKK